MYTMQPLSAMHTCILCIRIVSRQFLYLSLYTFLKHVATFHVCVTMSAIIIMRTCPLRSYL